MTRNGQTPAADIIRREENARALAWLDQYMSVASRRNACAVVRKPVTVDPRKEAWLKRERLPFGM